MLIGGMLCLLAAIFPVSGRPPVQQNVSTGTAMLAGAIGVLIAGRRVTTVILHVLVASGTIAMSAIIANASTGAGQMITAFAYVWICVYIGQFFTPNWARAHAGMRP